MSQRYQNHGPRFNYTAGIGLGLVLLAIVLGLAASRGVVPVPSFSLVGEPTRTPTPGPSRTATRTPHAEGTTVASATRTAVVVSTATGVPPSATLLSTNTPAASPTSVPTGNAPTITPSGVSTGTATVSPSPTVYTTGTAVVILGPVHYVSKLGNNAGGGSWASAWNEFSQINWSVVRPGDTVLVDGGSTSMTYTTQLAPQGSGFTIRLAPDAGRNGQVVIFGGRSTPLPYCQQATYVYQTVGVRLIGVDLGSASNVIVDGTKWRGLLIYGNNDRGINLGGSNNTVRYAEVTDNGQANFANGYWRPDRPGVAISGSGNKLDHDIIHDNGQDAIQTGSTINGFTISNSWLYNGRSHPVYGAAVPSGYCMHQDSAQVYDGGTSTGITIRDTILGPGQMQSTILGQTPGRAVVNNVTISNVLSIGSFNAGFMAYGGTNPTGWKIDHATIYTGRSPNWNAGPGTTPGTGWNEPFSIDGSGHSVTNTIVWDGRAIISGASFSGNCEWSPYGNHRLLSGTVNGVNANPQFRSPPPLTSPDATAGTNAGVPTAPTMQDYINADYTVTGGACAGKGASLTSVAMLLAQ